MNWAELFDRADEYDIEVASVREALASNREADA